MVSDSLMCSTIYLKHALDGSDFLRHLVTFSTKKTHPTFIKGLYIQNRLATHKLSMQAECLGIHWDIQVQGTRHKTDKGNSVSVTVDGSEIWIISHFFIGFLSISGGCLEFLTINSRNRFSKTF